MTRGALVAGGVFAAVLWLYWTNEPAPSSDAAEEAAPPSDEDIVEGDAPTEGNVDSQVSDEPNDPKTTPQEPVTGAESDPEPEPLNERERADAKVSAGTWVSLSTWRVSSFNPWRSYTANWKNVNGVSKASLEESAYYTYMRDNGYF